MARAIDIVARHRPPTVVVPDGVAIRWTFPPTRRFPDGGFTLTRQIGGATGDVLRDWRLPGAVQVAPGEWIIDPTQLALDLNTRSAHPSGPRPPPPAIATELIPSLSFALPRASPDMIESSLEGVAKLFGESHETDLELEHLYWKGQRAPDHRTLRLMRHSANPDDVIIYDAVVEHYQKRSTAFLLFQANEFGMAKFLGLGVEDTLPPGSPRPIRYEIEASWNRKETWSTTADQAGVDWPKPPSRPAITQGQTFAGYPPFDAFYGVRSSWQPKVPAAGGQLFDDLVALARTGVRTYPSPSARLTWDVPKEGGEGPPLLSHGAWYWQIERHSFGAASATEEVQPPIDAMTHFDVCHDGEYVLRGLMGRFEDDIALPWGEQPLEGWYAYRIRGIDLFGIAGPPSDPGFVRLLDVYPPIPPRPVLDRARIELPEAGVVTLPVSLFWDAANEYSAPDATEFRIYQHWTPVEYSAVLVLKTLPIGDALNAVQIDVEVGDEGGVPLPEIVRRRFIGGTLLTPDGNLLSLTPRRILQLSEFGDLPDVPRRLVSHRCGMLDRQ
jgi:hypothetical protein